MKRKELKNLAQEIATAENIIQTSSDPEQVMKAQGQIIELSGHALSIEDMIAIDEFVQELLKK